jgi:hypothetical protein
MEENSWTYLFLFLTGACKGVMDVLNFKYRRSIFFGRSYWNMDTSWMYKWKGNNPVMGERFWGSSTIFVWLTDGWHLVQFFMIKFIFLAVLFHSEFIMADLIGVTFYYAGFWSIYESGVLIRKNEGT